MSDPFQPSSTIQNPGRDLIRQFVIYAENKVGWLNDFIMLLKSDGIHILAISVLDTSDSSVIQPGSKLSQGSGQTFEVSVHLLY